MRTLLALVPILAVSGCSLADTKTVTTTTTTSVTETVNPHENDAYPPDAGPDLADDVTKEWNRSYPDRRITDMTCSPAPAFENDASRWECVGDAAGGSITLKVKVNQSDGSFVFESTG